MDILFSLVFLYFASAFHNDGGGCYNYDIDFSLIGGSGVVLVAPIDPKVDTDACTIRTNFTLWMPDCTTPFTNTHPNVVITEPTEFLEFGDISVDTTSPVEGHPVVTCCIHAEYHGYVGTVIPSNYAPTSYFRVITFRICEDYITATMDTAKAFYYEDIFAYDIGV